MVLEALAAIGLASSIVQFVDFTARLFAKTNELSRSLDGTDKESLDLKSTAEVLSRIGEGLATTFDTGSQDETDLLLLADGCKGVVDELLTVLEKLRNHSNRNRWQNFRQALRYMWAQDKLETMSRRVEQYRQQIGLSLQKLIV